MRRRTIERRLFDAVLLVLAGTGCQPPAGAARGPSNAAPATVEPAGWPTTIAPDQDTPAYCEAYKRGTRVDATTATPPPLDSRDVRDAAYWDPNLRLARCTLVRERTTATVEILYTPTCCPMTRQQGTCSPPSKIQVPGEKLLVERVDLRPDGTVASSALAWQVVEANPRPRHACGRRPEDLAAPPGERVDPDSLGSQLAELAELEAASIPAFDRLARELAAHGAPSALIRRARAAMRDEVRHARTLHALAVAHGRTPRAIELGDLPCRALEDIARENAVEGCVHEAFGAIVATYQATCAEPGLRATFAAIADDERRHAALAEDVDAWIRRRLDGAARDRVTCARTTAIHAMRDRLRAAPQCAALGLPSAAHATALFDAYFC